MSRFLNPQQTPTNSASPMSSTMLPFGLTAAVFNVPVKFADLGKDCKDLLGKDFPYDSKKIEVNTVTPNKVTFTVIGQQNNAGGAPSGEMKIKYAYAPKGITFTQKWSIDNLLTTEIEAKDTFAKGLSHKLETQFIGCNGLTNVKAPSNALKVSADYVRRYLHLDTSLDLLKGPTLTASIVTGYQGYFAGGEVAMNAQSGNVDRYTATSAIYGNDYQFLLTARNKLTEFAASYYHSVNSNLSTGCTATLNSTKGNQVVFEFGSAIKLTPISSAKVKMASNGQLTLAYAQELATGVKGTISALVNTRSLEKDAAKVGLQLNFNA